MPFADSPFTVTRVDPVRWCLVDPLVYQGQRQSFRIPAGFVTDFATVPWWVQSLIPRTGSWTLAAVLHDWLCTELARWHSYRLPTPFLVQVVPVNARDADGLFRRVLREEGTDVVRCWLMWTGVRWGALANPARRAGWWRDAPAVLGISALVLAPLVLAIHLVTR
jgi:hypothetical protein